MAASLLAFLQNRTGVCVGFLVFAELVGASDSQTVRRRDGPLGDYTASRGLGRGFWNGKRLFFRSRIAGPGQITALSLDPPRPLSFMQTAFSDLTGTI